MRTDSKSRTLDSYITTCPITNIPTLNLKRKIDQENPQPIKSQPINPNNAFNVIEIDSNSDKNTDTETNTFQSIIKTPSIVSLTSILNLRKSVIDTLHNRLFKTIRDHTFVGIVNDRQALIQHRTKLIIIDYKQYA